MAENNNHQVANLPKHPHPELRKLDPLIGRWRIEGPDVKGEATYEWMEGGFFFIQHYDLVNFGSHHKGIEYADWDEDTGTIRSRRTAAAWKAAGICRRRRTPALATISA